MKDVLDTPLPDQERLLEMVAESLPVEVLEPRKRVEVLIVGGSNGPFFDTIRALAATRGIDLVAHVAEVTPPREVLFVEGFARRSTVVGDWPIFSKTSASKKSSNCQSSASRKSKPRPLSSECPRITPTPSSPNS